jgi:hypothetical protein
MTATETKDAAARRQEETERRASERMMSLLTLNLTHEGDSLLIGVAAVAVFASTYPLVGVWALLAFPVVFAAAVLIRSRLRKRS